MVSIDQLVTPLDLDFSGPGFMISGQLAGPAGPLRDTDVTLRSSDDTDDAQPHLTWTDYHGEFRFGPLPPGTYVLEAYDGAQSGTPIVRRVLTVDEDLQVSLTAGVSGAP
jgi:hypothetical protein